MARSRSATSAPVAVKTALVLATLVMAGVSACAGDDDATDASAPATAGSTVDGATDDDAADDETTATTFDPGTSPTTSAPTAPATSVLEPTGSSAEPATSTGPGAPTGSPTTPPADDGSCLHGSWVVTDQAMNDYVRQLMTTVDAPITMIATGRAGLDVAADGTYVWTPEFDLVVDVVGEPGTGLLAGSITGGWRASAGAITTVSDVNAVTMSITVNSTTFNGSDLAGGLLNSSPLSGATYSCTGATPVIDFKTADPELTVPVTLTPA